MLPQSAFVKAQRQAVRAVALAAAVPRAVVEEVAEVRVAAGAADLCPRHAVRSVLEQLDGVGRDGLGEAGPVAAGLVLRFAIEELVAAGAASESDLSSVARWPTEETRSFGRQTASVARGGSARYAGKDESCRLCTVTA